MATVALVHFHTLITSVLFQIDSWWERFQAYGAIKTYLNGFEVGQFFCVRFRLDSIICFVWVRFKNSQITNFKTQQLTTHC